MATSLAQRRLGHPGANPRSPRWQQIVAARWCYLFMLPSLILATMFTFWPIVASWYFSLLDFSGFSSARPFIGLANYRELIHDPFFWRSLGHSFLFSPFNGPINKTLLALHLAAKPIDFLGNPHSALWTIMGVQVWKSFGFTMIYWLAALQAVPAELYEAAKVDGAGRWRQFRNIILPLLKPFAVVILLITAVNTLRVFDLVQTMTGGGPYFASEVVEVYIYRNAFSISGGIPREGYASAVGVFFGLTVMVVALGQAWAIRKANAVRQDLTVGGKA